MAPAVGRQILPSCPWSHPRNARRVIELNHAPAFLTFFVPHSSALRAFPPASPLVLAESEIKVNVSAESLLVKMGNCQAAEAATVVIQLPGGAVERIYWSVSVKEVMGSNPGHYVASVTSAVSAAGTPVKHLKLLRPDDTLHIGHVYRLVSFQELLKEFAEKKYAKLGKLLAMQKQVADGQGRPERRGAGGGGRGSGPRKEVDKRVGAAGKTSGGVASGTRPRQWKPALQSIAELGT